MGSWTKMELHSIVTVVPTRAVMQALIFQNMMDQSLMLLFWRHHLQINFGGIGRWNDHGVDMGGFYEFWNLNQDGIQLIQENFQQDQ